MPNPVKKAPKKSTTAKRPSSDPNVRAHQLMREIEARQATTPASASFEAQYRARMSELGRKGGKIGGKRRLETMTPQKRSEQALKAVRARWGKPRKTSDGA